ncbi:MAG: RNA pseudouridine synthase [Thermoguttaceae bacterium]|jgi:RluA family pseudouridine synthase|nr:RNA pseudouridine synthase [Thermoguttaceae bacterium]
MLSPGFELLYEFGPCLVVCKPPGVLTQAPPGIDSLEVRVKAFLQRRENLPRWGYLGVPHRLDRPASGAMVLGRTRRATQRLSEQFSGRRVEKIYWALVEGHIEPSDGVWEDTMRKVPGEPRAELVQPECPGARPAILRYGTVGMTEWGSWLEIVLETGRTHQIRLQAASRGHPILGDFQYGASLPFGPHCDDPRDQAIALHARRLAFQHPKTREAISVEAPTPLFWPQGT